MAWRDPLAKRLTVSVLHPGEAIVFQIQEGPCAAGCTYCYEEPVARKIIDGVVALGRLKPPGSDLNVAQLAAYMTKNADELGTVMPLAEIAHYFDLLKAAGINHARLIGSEPTMHPQFEEILDAAHELGINLLVYTSGLKMEPLYHSAIAELNLHLDYERNAKVVSRSGLTAQFERGELPTPKEMAHVNLLIERGKRVNLRVNFSDESLWEAGLIFSFYNRLDPRYLSITPLKYSFSTRVAGTDVAYFEPESMRRAALRIVGFVDAFKARFPDVPMQTDRPIFPCSFEPAVWKTYVEKGGFVARCAMEYTVYHKDGLALCPPSRALEVGEQIEDSKQLVRRIEQLRAKAEGHFGTPSFPQCEPCQHRLDMTCQGGCGGYKVSTPNPALFMPKSLVRPRMAAR